MPYQGLTENESSILNIIGRSEFNQNNGSLPRTVEESATWLFIDDLADDSGLTINQTKGVLGSLVKKGIIYIDIDELDGGETMVQISQEGIHCFWDV
jgi:hypothetical protein